jgi:drug/metabolite transporter (DMT)-like permease
MLGGAIVSLAAALPLMGGVKWTALSPGLYGALAYSTVGAMVVAYLFWYYGVKVLGPTRTSMYGNLQPVMAMLVAWLALHEMPTGWQVTGAVLTTSGLVLARTAGSEPEAP